MKKNSMSDSTDSLELSSGCFGSELTGKAVESKESLLFKTQNFSLQDSAANQPWGASQSAAFSLALCDDQLLRELRSIPQVMFFKIGDVAELLGVRPYVLRYWESEFELLRPKKAKNNQRMYSRRHVEIAFLLKKLLYRDKFSMSGAKAALGNLRLEVKSEVKLKTMDEQLQFVGERLSRLIFKTRALKRLF